MFLFAYNYLFFPIISLIFISFFLLYKSAYRSFFVALLLHIWLFIVLIYMNGFVGYFMMRCSYNIFLFFIFIYFVMHFCLEFFSFNVKYELNFLFLLCICFFIFTNIFVLWKFDLFVCLIGLFVFSVFRLIYLKIKLMIDVSRDRFPTFLNRWTYLWFVIFFNTFSLLCLFIFWGIDIFLIFNFIQLDYLNPILFFIGLVFFPYCLYICDYFVDYIFRKLFSLASVYSYRAQTLKVSLKWILRVFFGVVYIIMWLGVLSFNISTVSWNLSLIVAMAGVGFKGIIDDFMNGICVLIEDSVNIGEFISVAGVSGNVEDVTLRVIKLRNFDGSFYVVPFRMVSIIRNRSKEFVCIVFEVGVDVKVNALDVITLLKDAFIAFKNSKDALPFLGNVLEDLEIVGIKSVYAAGVVYEARLKISPRNTRFIKAVYLKCLKDLANERNIEFGFEYSVINKID